MKILWVTNCPFPEAAKELSLAVPLSQGWVLDLGRLIGGSEEINLSVISPGNVKKLQRVRLGGLEHYIIPQPGRFHFKKCYDKDIIKVFESFHPDLIHIFGTENDLGPAMMGIFPEIPVLLTIQGIMDRISEEYWGGLRLGDVLRYRTLRENLRLGGMFFAKIRLKKQRETERETIKRVTHVTGRTLWDYTVMKKINPDIKYHRCNFNLRAEFYDAPKWNNERIERHTVYTGYSDYPLKGLHVLLDALKIVKERYPDVILYVPGVAGDRNGRLTVNTGYKKLIAKRLKKLGLQNNVFFMGPLKANQVVERMLKCNVVVVPSAMEGASATICEGMYLGLPCICSYRGGMTELLKDGLSGYYYDYPEYGYLAQRIIQLFENDELCKEFSERLIIDAEERHNREKNPRRYIEVYMEVVNGHKKKGDGNGAEAALYNE